MYKSTNANGYSKNREYNNFRYISKFIICLKCIIHKIKRVSTSETREGAIYKIIIKKTIK
jgi:hypothetical protein